MKNIQIVNSVNDILIFGLYKGVSFIELSKLDKRYLIKICEKKLIATNDEKVIIQFQEEIFNINQDFDPFFEGKNQPDEDFEGVK